MAALWAAGAKSLAKFVVAGAAVWHVFVAAGRGGELVLQEVADRIAFKEEGLCVLLA